ncbi:hypothetical protein Nepgr_024677 [Nepenthes gracilis]|uniref:Mitochondrial import inner membrane translocase subunit Tim21 n=1 Tax=Nepenthes gracilis TaxID=150966 RepID=A0AAD3T5L5_NEPGR|nr:hypothetical protein Nepgr_024677 [Nepenthes gracilis]
MWRRRVASLLKPTAEACSTSRWERFSRATNPSQIVLQSGCTDNLLLMQGVIGGNGISSLYRRRQKTFLLAPANTQLPYQPSEAYGTARLTYYFHRSFASRSSSGPPEQNQDETRKDLSTAEDPFDSPTYHIPEKPVTFAEGASYSVIILVGLGIAAVAAYGVFKELIFQPKEYKVFSKALERVQHDSQVRVRIGDPIKGYGQESRNRGGCQRIPHRKWEDEDGVEHVQVYFHISGPHGGGRVDATMFRDKADRHWKFLSLIVHITSPSPTQLILESYLPA